MAKAERTPGKSKVKDIATALLNSEIPEIRTIVGELAKNTRQLEEHSQKLQSYAVEIQELAGEEVEMSVEANLVERLKGLEKTLTEIVGEPTKVAAKPKAEVVKVVEEEVEEGVEAKKPVAPAPSLFPRFETYVTPEGFVVRRRRY